MRHRITHVEKGSVAERHGLKPGDALLGIDGETLLDEIDYQALTFPARIALTVLRASGREERLLVRKEEGEPLGLRLGESMALSPRACKNKCIFCFIDQMPPGLRQSLYVKDDDWRYSLMMGNYVTLTNVDEEEFRRILRRRASPLYVSVHATDPELRRRMMGNPSAGELMPRLQRLKEAGLRFHCQVVVCPGLNDGEALRQTLRDLRGLTPAALSVALVPVGLTKWRQGLAALRSVDAPMAKRLLAETAPFQAECRKELGTAFVFPSDEFFCLAGEDIPPEEWYEGYPQIENGVGLLRLLESELEEAARENKAQASYGEEQEKGEEEARPERVEEDREIKEARAEGRPCPEEGTKRRERAKKKESAKPLLIATGVSAASHIARLAERFAPAGTPVRVLPIINRFFGETVTVAGLVTGGDLLAQLPQHPEESRLLIPACMLRHEGDRFLDDMTLEEFQSRSPLPVRVVGMSGQEFLEALWAR